MNVHRIAAITLRVEDMKKSHDFYSRLPGFKLVYGGTTEPFTTFEIEDSKMYFNLELKNASNTPEAVTRTEDSKRGMKRADFGRIIFHTKDVDKLYHFMRNDKAISRCIAFENEPSDAPWGERFFHVREPDGYQLSFAQPLVERANQRN